jgi:hypothetical protein
LAMGFTSKDVGLDVHRVKAKKLLESINVA